MLHVFAYTSTWVKVIWCIFWYKHTKVLFRLKVQITEGIHKLSIMLVLCSKLCYWIASFCLFSCLGISIKVLEYCKYLHSLHNYDVLTTNTLVLTYLKSEFIKWKLRQNSCFYSKQYRLFRIIIQEEHLRWL